MRKLPLASLSLALALSMMPMPAFAVVGGEPPTLDDSMQTQKSPNRIMATEAHQISCSVSGNTLTIAGQGQVLITDLNSVSYSDKKKIEDIIIEEGVSGIADGSWSQSIFKGFSKLSSVSLPATLKRIGNYAFADCESLLSVNFGNGIEEIGNSAFSGCSSLKSVKLGSNVRSIGDSAFYEATNLSSVEISGAAKLGTRAFYNCDALTTVSFPQVTSVGASAFIFCDSLKSVNLPRVTNIGEEAFGMCDALESVTFDSAETIECIHRHGKRRAD